MASHTHNKKKDKEGGGQGNTKTNQDKLVATVNGIDSGNDSGLNHGLEETPQCPSGDITNEGQGDHLKKNSKQGMNESGKQRIELEGGQKENTIAE